MALIPAFGPSGVLPPFSGTDPTVRAQVSPYAVSMTEFVKRFATTSERIVIARGLLDFRADLVALGISRGFQWIDGSYVEDCESVRQRPPADVDIVTFSYRPNKVTNSNEMTTFISANLEIFIPQLAKKKYRCDAYYVDLNKPSHLIVSDTAYFNGLFSHQRDTSLWKGMLRIELNSDDAAARAMI